MTKGFMKQIKQKSDGDNIIIFFGRCSNGAYRR